jgi:hypothetical protein
MSTAHGQVLLIPQMSDHHYSVIIVTLAPLHSAIGDGAETMPHAIQNTATSKLQLNQREYQKNRPHVSLD